MKFRWDKKYLYWGTTAFLVIVLSIMFFLGLYRFNEVLGALGFILDILMPFITGFVIAYLLLPIVEFFENKCFYPMMKRNRNPRLVKLPRVIAIIVTLLLAFALVAGLLLMVIPQLINSIMGIAGNMNTYIANLENWVLDLVASNAQLENILEEQFDNISKFLTDWATNNLLPQMEHLITGVTSGVMGVVNTLVDIFIGLIVAIYVMFSKERFAAQSKKMTYAVFSIKTANGLVRITRRADKVFGSFIKGKLIDSTIIGLLCFIGMSAFRMPFALLISVIIGIFNIIPFFGPIIGAVPSALLILMADISHPLTCVYFIIFIVVLQQFDGNVLGPKILGETTGLSAFWITFAIMVFSGLFGFVGMIIGVPTFTLIYSFVCDWSETRLKRQKLPVDTDDYNRLDHISAVDGEIRCSVIPTPEKAVKPSKKRKWFNRSSKGK